MIRSDQMSVTTPLPGPAPAVARVCVRRACPRARRLAGSPAANGRRGSSRSARRRRGRVGQEPARARARPRGRGRGDRPLRRLRRCRRRLPTGRSCRRSSTSSRTPSRRRCAGTSARAAVSWRGFCPACASGSATCRAPRRTPTPSVTACTRPSRTSSSASAPRRRCCSSSRTCTGPTRRRSS